jgi:hypothetical protein
MKSLKQFAVVVIFAALAGAGLHAQSIDLRANIPFEFHVGDALFPAGEYTIHGEGSVVILHGDNGVRPRVTLTIAASGRDLPRQPQLDFNCYGSEYFLAKIWDSFAQNGRQVLPTAREKELAQRGVVPVQTQIIIARSR